MLLDQEAGPTAQLADLPIETRFEWVAALPQKARQEYLNSLGADTKAELVTVANKHAEQRPAELRAAAEKQWEELSAEEKEKHEAEAATIASKFSLPSPLGEACKAIQAIYLFGYNECGKVYASVANAYPEWILKALKEKAPTTCGQPMTDIWANGLCKDMKQAVAQPMLPLYLCHAGLVSLDGIADVVDAMLVDTADGYPKPANIFRDQQVDDYLKMALCLKILGDVPEHAETVKEWVDDYFTSKWVALFKDPESLTSQNEWFQAAVGPNTMKMRWIREGLTEVAIFKGWNATE